MPHSRQTPMSSMPFSSPAAAPSPVAADGVRPALAELFALRGSAIHLR
ncbi:DUF58 domain-containing protein, partial [Xanthomonas perforans]|nr:DUF58 domain-containing protein [Xanthomonas perforans]